MDKHFVRARFTPPWPLGEDGRAVTGCQAHIDLARAAAQESMVLLKNNGVLPLKKGQKLAVFGSAQVAYEQGGSGAGIVYTAYSRNLYEGLCAKEAAGQVEIFHPLSDFFRAHYEKEAAYVEENFSFGPESRYRGDFILVEKFNLRGKEALVPEALVQQAAAFADTAIICLGRTSGEFYDREVDRDFNLTAEEKAMITQAKANFANVIVMINAGAQIEAGWLGEDGISAVVFMGTPGMEGGNAAADVLCGDVCPSGKLVDTFARTYADYPTGETFAESDYYVNYEEDIFVGYRYFETIPGAAEKVVYPFGFGLSYTTFSQSVESVCEEDGKIVITAKVTNTGTVAGKQILQVYGSAPQGKLGKAAKVLVAFGKTEELAPGESQNLTLVVDPYLLASYDDTGIWQKSAYILEGGDYRLYLGTSVRDVAACYTYHVDGDFRLIQQLTERCPCLALPRKMHADGSFEELPMKGMPRPQEFPYPPAITEKAPETLKKLDAVADGEISLDAFIAQMSNEQLFTMLGGHPNTGVAVTGCFGNVPELGIPAYATSDAPAGIRVKPAHCLNPVAFPTAVCLACTWNEALVEQVGEAIAKEIKENNMFAWLGPALNIHRDPLGGRNFEYYSEDPLIAGKMAAASVRGAQRQRISGSPKHFAANNKEFIRKECDSRVTERALREIYLKGFEICVKESDPKTIMTSYNPVNGIYASESADLQTHILRGEWGFSGLTMTDWSGHGQHGREVKAGSDIKMSRGYLPNLRSYLHDGPTGGIFKGHLHAAVRRILTVFLWYEGIDL